MKLFLILLLVMVFILESQAAAKPYYWGREGGSRGYIYRQPSAYESGWYRPIYVPGREGGYRPRYSSEEGK